MIDFHKYSIGLDIGIASVGWAVLNINTQKIQDLGVRIFTARESDRNKERRDARGSRRLSTRKVTRINDAKKYLDSRGFHEDKSILNDCPYELRVKGLTEKLTKSELYRVILHILKKRGVSYLDDTVIENESSKDDYKGVVEKNIRLIKDNTPGEIQLHRLKEDGRVRTGKNIHGKYNLNVFPVSAYAKELQRILDTQSHFYDEIDESFMDYFLAKSEDPEKLGLFFRKRPYYHGPGNANNPSEYGRWADFPVTGEPADNIFDKLIGKDFLGGLRASTNSVSAQVYNLLNDLNNLTINREEKKLSTEEKQKVLDHLMKEEVKQFGYKQLLKLLNLNEEEVRGFRVDRNGKPEIHSMASYRRWKKILAENNIDISTLQVELLNELAKIITLNSEKEGILYKL